MQWVETDVHDAATAALDYIPDLQIAEERADSADEDQIAEEEGIL